VNLIESPKVQSIRESGKEYIDIDIEHLQEEKFYYVVYHGDTYGIEKLSDGQIVVYEVIE
jgi:predicted small secreted protein